MKHFFISYNSADKGWAEWIAWQLEEAGYTTILQAWDFRPGHNFVLKMDRASQEAERIIIVLSHDFLSSSFTPPEWAVFFKKDPTGDKGLIVPVRVKKCELIGLLSTINRIDLIGLDEEAAKKALLDNIRFERAKPTTPPGFPGSRSVAEKPRFPGALPPVWNVPFNRNPNFTGRESLLADLRAALTSGQPVALHGLGGTGKTQIAVQYAYHHMADYQVVWWIRSEESATLASDYADLASDLDLPKIDDQRDVIRAIRLWLGRNKDWLLVFDNAEDPADIRDYLPQGGRGNVIITSRYSTDWGRTATALEVKKLDRAEAIEFLHKRTKQEDEDAAGQLAEELDGLPLALEQAGAYILATRITLAKYLELFRTKRKELWKDEKPPEDHHDKVDTTWNLAMDRVREKAPEGADLLNLCAFLAPDDIPRILLGKENVHLPESLADPLALNRAVDGLQCYSLIDASYESLSVHRLVQAVTRDRLSDDERKNFARSAEWLVDDTFPDKSDDVRNWLLCSLLLPHALTAAEHVRSLEMASETTAHLLSQVGLYLNGRAELVEANSVLERSLTIAENVYGPDHIDVAMTLNKLSVVLRKRGKYKEAQDKILKALDIFEVADDSYLSEKAKAFANLGLTSSNLKNYPNAKVYLQKSLDIKEAIFGPEDVEVAKTLGNFGSVLKEMNDLTGAKEKFERSLSIFEKVEGNYGPNVGKAVGNLCDIMLTMGELSLEDAKKCFEQALGIIEKAFGSDHLDVAYSANNVGAVLCRMGDLEGAKKNYDRSLKICRELLGEDHPNTMKVRNNLEALGR